jgi:uncharacterized protein YgfB (UPF0149 family)
MLQVTFAEVAHSLHDLGSEAPAAEGHGCLCGALCINAGYTFERWREELLGSATPPQADPAAQQVDEEPLRLLFNSTAVALGEATEEFALLLPEDDVALEQRTAALAQWTSGFLYGFGTALPRSAATLPPNVDEVLSDFGRMAAATVDPDSDTEEQEQAYAELVEYVRAGVWLLYAELTALRAGGPDGAPAALH